jgi:hypothetical protein
MNYQNVIFWTAIPLVPTLIYIYIKDPKEDGSGFGPIGFAIFSLLNKVFRK